MLSVNNRQVVLFTSITLNIALAHEFGHAFGLEHTFKAESKDEKKKEGEFLESDGFYTEVRKKIKAVSMFVDNKHAICIKSWKNYKGQKGALWVIDISLTELKNMTRKELDNENVNNKLTNNTVKKSISISQEFLLKEGDTKENFMDYLKSDRDRKCFDFKQITTVCDYGNFK